METEQQSRRKDRSDELFETPTQAAPMQARARKARLTAGRRPRWWWIELWFEKRKLFKEAVAHIFLFAGLLGSLELAHWLLKLSTLPPDELYVLNKVHFYMYAIILVIFAFSFVIKVLKSEFSGDNS